MLILIQHIYLYTYHLSIYLSIHYISEAHNCTNEWVDEWFHFGHLHIEGRKMSKSLKNFISINDYMNSKITKSPGDDFRIYCLQYKYHASLTYSIERIKEAEVYRKKIENFIYHMKSILILSSYQSIMNNNNTNNYNNNNIDKMYLKSSMMYTNKGRDNNNNNDVDLNDNDDSNRKVIVVVIVVEVEMEMLIIEIAINQQLNLRG